MSLSPGARFGPYEILSLLGAGGMGEVYRARDTRLRREVAIKILLPAVANDPERLARFSREAQILASLNHPHIAQIYGLEESDLNAGKGGQLGIRALVMELVEGPTLAELVAGAQGLRIAEAISIARQIAEALEAAHDQGIIHRDLKPANVKVRPDGTVKVLDFGLAKAMDPLSASSPQESPTVTSPAMMTGAGVILGTAAYMSPEQARGRPADRRSDIWAFGCVLFEMLTGRRAFNGDSISETLASVLKEEPDWTALPASAPALIPRLLRRCLEKSRAGRLDSAAAVRLELEEALRVPEPADKTGAVRPVRAVGWRRAWFPLTIAAVAAAAAGIFVWNLMRSEAPSAAPVRFAVAPVARRVFVPESTQRDLAITPDGSRIVYLTGGATATEYWVQSLERLEAVRLAQFTHGTTSGPAISPDGAWFAIDTPTELKKLALNGGTANTVCRLDGSSSVRGITWGSDGWIVFGDDRGLFVVPAAGGVPKSLTTIDRGKGETGHVSPSFLPDGQTVLFTIADTGLTFRIAAVNLKSGEHKLLIERGSQPQYAATGHLLYADQGALRAVRFDPSRLEVLGEPVTVVESVLTKLSGASDFAMSRNGTLVYVPGTASLPRSLVWVDRSGREEPISAPPRGYAYVHVSPDGGRLALDIRDQQNDIWTWDVARRTLSRLTFDPGPDRGGVWTPDGRHIAFSGVRDGAPGVFRQAWDGTGSAERLTKGSEIQLPTGFTPDGTTLLIHQPDRTPHDLGAIHMADGGRSELLLHAPHDEENGVVSPDGRWLAYDANEAGTWEVFVRTFPNLDGGKWQVSDGGGAKPIWSRDGRELFFIRRQEGTTGVRAVSIQTGPTFTQGVQETLFEGPYFSGFVGRTYDASPDGKRFVMIKDAQPQSSSNPSMVVVLNWLDELKRVVP